MADTTGGENIGGINVSIGADYSPLQAAFSTAEDLAQKAGADIADALASGASSAGNVGDVISGQLEQIGPAADDAGSSLEGFSGEATDAGEAAESSASKLAELAEQMTAVGEALIITEGLKELGEEALGAADSITHASIALTTITGSADTAKETIEGLEQLGMSDGLAMPSLLSAATRMQQILGPATDVTEELKKVADGAAAMGTDIETAAQKFDQIASAGTASARTLTSLGISLQGLADAFNTVQGGVVETSTSIAAAFKALDQSERIEVLNQALSTLGGTAEQVANQTFGGQWQQLANAWEGLMVQAGQALLPVISGILQLTKTEIVPFLQSAMAEFSALPTPVKDVAAALVITAAAVIPLTGALAAIGLGLAGLQTVVPVVSGLMANLSGEAKVAAESEAEQAIATGEMATAAAAAVPEVEALAVAEGQLSFGFASELVPAVGLVGEQLSLELLPAIEGVGTGLAAFTTDVGAAGLGLMAIGPIAGLLVLSAASLKDGWNQAKDTFSNVAGTVEQLPGVLTAAADAGGALGTAATTLHSAWSSVLSVFENYNTYSLVAKGINEIVDAVDVLTGVVPGATQMTEAFGAAIGKLQTAGTQSKEATEALAASIKAAGLAALDGGNQLTAVQQAIGNIVVAQDKANDAFKTAQQVYQTLGNSLATGQAIYNGSAASANDVAIAFKNLQAAAAAVGATVAPVPGSIDAITQASTKLANAGGVVISALQQEQDTQTAANASMDLAQKSYNASQIALSSYTSQLKLAQDANNGTAQSESAVTTAEQNVQKAYASSQSELKGLTDTVQNYITYMNGSGASTKAQIDLLQDLADKFGPATSAAIGLTDQIKALQGSLPAFGVQITSFNSGPIAGLQSAFDETTKNVAKFQAQMDAGQNSGQQYEKALTAQLKALVDLNVAMAESSTGLQGQSDSYSLAAIAVAAAQAKYDTLNAAFQTNITLAPQVKAAQDALTNAQKAMNEQTTTAISLTSQLDQQYPQLNSGINSATTAFNTQTTAMQSNVKALNDVAASVLSVEADMKEAFQSVSDGQVKIAAQQGTYFSGGLLTGGGNGFGTESTAGAYYDTPAAAYAKALAAAQQTTPVSGTSASALAQDVLAQAQAVLQVYEQFYGAGVGVTASDIQNAQQAVATAQKALSTAGGSTSSSSTSTGTSTSPYSNPIVGGTPINLNLPGFTSGSTTTASTSSTVSASTSGGGGTSAIDGGSYPAVTAHQAVGEVWAVSTGGSSGTGGGGVSSNISTSISNTVVGGSDSTALQAATQAIGNVGQQIAANSGDLLPISESLLQTAQATQQLATAVAGIVHLVNGGTSSVAPAATTTSTGSGYTVGSPTQTVGGGNPLGTYVPPSSAPVSNIPGYNPFGPGSVGGGTTTVNVTVNAQGSIGLNTQQLNAQITSAVVNNLVPQLQTAGARLTR
jgi:hypothetical protein